CCSCSSVFFVSSDVLTATSLFVVTSSTCSVCSFLISLSINDSPLFYAHRRNVLRSISYSFTTSRSIVLRFFSAFYCLDSSDKFVPLFFVRKSISTVLPRRTLLTVQSIGTLLPLRSLFTVCAICSGRSF